MPTPRTPEEFRNLFIPAIVRSLPVSDESKQTALDEIDKELGPIDTSAPDPDKTAPPELLDEARQFANAATGVPTPQPQAQVPATAPQTPPPAVPVQYPAAMPQTLAPPSYVPTATSPPASSEGAPPPGPGADQAPATRTPSDGPVTSPRQVDETVRAPEAGPPRNPLQVPAYARGVNQETSQYDLELQRQQNDISVQAAEMKARALEEQAAVEIAAQKAADARVKAVQDAQDRAREELGRRSDVLAKAAEQRLAERPGAQTRASGRALLAIATGMGSKSAEALFNASLAEEERNERNDIARKQADIDALSKSTGAAGDQFQMLGVSALNEQNLANAQSIAREKVAIRQLEAGVASRLGPGSARITGEQLVNDLKRKAAERETALAHAEVTAVAQAQALEPKRASVPLHEPKMPSKAAGQSKESYQVDLQNYYRDKQRYDAQVATAGKAGAKGPSRASQMMAEWDEVRPPSTKAAAAAPSTTPTPEAQPRTRSAPAGATATAPARAKAAPTATGKKETPSFLDRLIEEGGRLFRGPDGSAKAAPPAKAPTVEELARATAEAQAARATNIDVPSVKGGKPFTLTAAPGREIREDDENTKKLRTNISKIASFRNNIIGLATLVTDFQGKDLGDFVRQYGTRIPGLIGLTDKQAAEGVLRSYMMAELSQAQGQGVINVHEEPRYENSIASTKLFQDPKSAASSLATLYDVFNDNVANQMTVAGYDATKWNEDAALGRTLITSLGEKPVGPKEQTAAEGESDKSRIDAKAKVDALEKKRAKDPSKAAEFDKLFEQPSPWSGGMTPSGIEHFDANGKPINDSPPQEPPNKAAKLGWSNDPTDVYGTPAGQYRIIADSELRREKAIDDYKMALFARDYIAADEANGRRLKEQGIQAQAAHDLLKSKAGRATAFHTSTPEMQQHYLGEELPFKSRTAPTSDWLKYRPLIKDLLDSNGAVTGRFKD